MRQARWSAPVAGGEGPAKFVEEAMKITPPELQNSILPELRDAVSTWGQESDVVTIDRWTRTCETIIRGCPKVWRSNYGLSVDQMCELIPKLGEEHITLEWVEQVSKRFEGAHSWPGRRGAYSEVLKFIQKRMPVCSNDLFIKDH